MNKSKSGLVILAILIYGLAGCSNTQKEGDVSSRTENQGTGSSGQEYSDSLCTYDEEVLFGFNIVNSVKKLSVCTSNNKPDYVVYRLGTKDNIEMDFPENIADSWNEFTYSYYLRGGGAVNEGMDLNYLMFENDGSEYKIYEEYTAKDNVTQVGVEIINKEAKTETELKGLSSSVEGSLINLRDNKRIKIEIQ